MRRWTSEDEAATRAVGRALAAELAPDGVLLLWGDLGSGKTVLVQGLGEGLGMPAGQIQSPTYTLVQEHAGPGGRLVHLDLYRLAPEETWALGLEEIFAGAGVKAVEWAERLPFEPAGALALKVERHADGRRSIEELEGGKA